MGPHRLLDAGFSLNAYSLRDEYLELLDATVPYVFWCQQYLFSLLPGYLLPSLLLSAHAFLSPQTFPDSISVNVGFPSVSSHLYYSGFHIVLQMSISQTQQRLRRRACVFICLVPGPFIKSLEPMNVCGTKDWLPEWKQWAFEIMKKQIKSLNICLTCIDNFYE